jgi:hypothetical protein
MLRSAVAGMLVLVSWPGCAGATQICAWLVEGAQPGHVRTFDLWMESDADINFLYDVGGRGLMSVAGDQNSPTSATYALNANDPRKAWSYSATFYPPGKIEITLDIHETPPDIYSHASTPVLAKFAFTRDVPESETKPPDTFAARQCMEIFNGGLPL